MHILETGGSERGTKFSNKGVTFLGGLGLRKGEERGVEYSISLSLVKSRNWPMPP